MQFIYDNAQINCMFLSRRFLGYFKETNTMYRVLVYFKNDTHKKPIKAEFKQCILDYFGANDNSVKVYCELNGLKLILSPENPEDSTRVAITLKHPSFCPIHKLSDDDISHLSPKVIHRGIDVGVVILLQTSDDCLLLTRRAAHLRTFPGIWVPPGGHVKMNENLLQAGLRELKEETGLDIANESLDSKILALWESVFPPLLNHGKPNRHHIVVYYLCKIDKDHQSLQSLLSLDWNEVEVCAWLPRSMITTLVNLNQGNLEIRSQLPPTFKAIVIKNHDQLEDDVNLGDLIGEVCKEKGGRISTGTYFALSEWLQCK